MSPKPKKGSQHRSREHAREVTKTNTIEAETFKTLEFGALGVADLEAVRFYRAPMRRQTIDLSSGAKLGRVEIVSHYAGADGFVIRALLHETQRTRLDGLVIAATGLGNISETMYEAVLQPRPHPSGSIVRRRPLPPRLRRSNSGKSV